MQIESKIPVFDDFSHHWFQTEGLANPAETHGILAGLICTGQKLNGKFWFDTVLRLAGIGEEMAGSYQNIVVGLYDVTCRQLSGIESEFQLLLPNDSIPFTERAMALSDWCQGFIYGLDWADSPAMAEQMVEEVQEAMRCISELAKLDFTKIEITENDRAAFMSVAEFVRSAVIMIYAELIDQQIEHIEANKGTGHLH